MRKSDTLVDQLGTPLIVSVLIVGLSYGARNVLSHTRRMMPNSETVVSSHKNARLRCHATSRSTRRPDRLASGMSVRAVGSPSSLLRQSKCVRGTTSVGRRLRGARAPFEVGSLSQSGEMVADKECRSGWRWWWWWWLTDGDRRREREQPQDWIIKVRGLIMCFNYTMWHFLAVFN